MEKVFDTVEQLNAYNMIAKTNQSFFLTGRAGTGKTTFLKKIQNEVPKRFIVLAPTGIAAYNAGGQTIHSFFGFDRAPQTPGEIGSMSRAARDIIKNIDAIIVDEVSMVRCDIIDAMDRTLRFFRNSYAPFGGLQMIFVGDMYQLEPITPQDQKETLQKFYPYSSFYFYKAAVIRKHALPKIEFKKIYRQQGDTEFIELLEHIRTGKVTSDDLAKLNQRVVGTSERNSQMKITLTCFKNTAQDINDAKLYNLPGEVRTYEATVVGNVKNCTEFAPSVLELKAGAQVMFTKNDTGRRWVNGTLGVIDSLTDDAIMVKLENGITYEVQKTSWDSIEYKYVPEKKRCEKEIVGSIVQYPLKLAWAITIHKSQSLTFDNVAIDFGRGAFSNGQAYVALSRCRSLDGLELLTPLSYNSIKVSYDVKDFSSDCNDENLISRELCIGEAVGSSTCSNIDYDKAAGHLYDLAIKEIRNNGTWNGLREYMERALSYAIDDECLRGREWPTIDDNYSTIQILNAIGLFYSGHVEEAERILSKYEYEIEDDLDALYVLSRCYEELSDWTSVESTYMKMLTLLKSVRDSGADSTSFRKVIYRLAVINEKHYNDPGADLILMLIDENPGYDKYHLALRWMLPKYEQAVKAATEAEDDDVLTKMLFDSTVDDDEFIDRLHQERKAETKVWFSYRNFLRQLKIDKETGE